MAFVSIFVSMLLLTAAPIFGSDDVKTSTSNSEANVDLELSAKIEEFLRVYSKIKVGMTRKDLTVNFKEEAGFQSGAMYTYYYNKCVYIKVDFEFEKNGVNTLDDKILKYSRPYLDYAVMD